MVWEQDLDLRYTWVRNLLPGWEQSDPVGKTDEDIVSPQDLPRLVALKRRVVDTGQGVREEVALVASGETRIYDMTIDPLRDAAGRIIGLSGAAVDVTETKRLEVKLHAAQKLESIGVLAGGVAHDFNNLLTGILGNASLMLDDVPSGHPARPRLEAIIRGSEKAADLTSKLLAYAGKGQFVLAALDLSQLVKDILSVIHASIPKTARLHLALKRNLPRILGDPVQLHQLVMNLVINAGEAIGEDRPGTIRVNTGMQEISRYYLERNPYAMQNEIAAGAYVFVEVRDTGCGMDEATMAKIFDPFFSTKFTGRGLGLAAVHGIVRGHRGTLELYSAPGGGTTFKVLLPALP
jgi:PAS domain S-box-containing protein